MKVSELARQLGITTSAVRFYEAKGILPAAPRRSNGYRDYSGADVCRLRIVVALRGLGLDLAESGRLASLCSAGQCDEMTKELLAEVAERREGIVRARAELDHLDKELGSLERSLRTGTPYPGLCLRKET